MLLTWWRNRRRRRILARPFPVDWSDLLTANVWQFSRMPVGEQSRLKQCVQILVAEKYWEGCGGLTLSDEIRVTIAGNAGLLLIGRDGEFFDRLQSILVYPENYVAPETTYLPGGVVSETFGIRLGEAWHGGPVIVSWSNVARKEQPGEPGRNIVLHEFAHVLDMQTHAVDGTPQLDDADHLQTWKQVMTGEWKKLIHSAERGRATLLDTYGTNDEAEFFAVATECFFETPAVMADELPRLYNLLQSYYRLNPAAWMGRV